VLSGELGALVIGPLIERLGRADVRVIPVRNEFFGGSTAVTGLLTGADLSRVLDEEPQRHRYLLPDVCLSDDKRFLDGLTVADLPRPVEVVATDGFALRAALGGGTGGVR
jgi:NifB/MoaA-like Fe-S oxidoreductase